VRPSLASNTTLSATTRGVVFPEEPREADAGTLAAFEDLYGNRWDLVQPRGG